MSFKSHYYVPRLLRAGVATISVLMVAACRGDSTTGPSAQPPLLTQLPRQLSPSEQQLIDGSNGFAFSLFRAVDSIAGPDSNVFVSPLSASMALGMTTVGANGATLDSMRAVLGYRDMSVSQMADAYHSLITLLRSLDPAVDFRLANALWYNQSSAVLPSFLSTVQSDFDATAATVDFGDPATATLINHWVDSNTGGKIPSLVDPPPLSPQTVMFLANAIYFHGSWRQRFDATQTHDTLFTTRTGSTTPVQLMHLSTTAPVTITPGYTAVDLAYGNSAYTMTVIVPAAGVSLDSLGRTLRDGAWSTLSHALATSSGTADVQVDLPKFSLTWENSLNAPLTSLGMGIAFSDVADFSHMASGQPLHISLVIQKTFVNVDEEGTTAAAATGVIVVPVFVGPPIPIIRADHPFIYVLRERLSGTILFIGAFTHPPST